MSRKVIPDYAKDFKREYQYIRGINKICGEFIGRLDFGGDLFKSSKANLIKYHMKDFLKAQERGKAKDKSGFYIKYNDARNIEILEQQLVCYYEFYYDPDTFEFDQEYYDLHIDRDYPGFKELFELVSLFNDKINIEELTFSDFMSSTSSLSFDSDSDSD